jgi:membrane protein
MAATEAQNGGAEGSERAPAPDDPSKPQSPDDLTKASWVFVLRNTAREFASDQCTDLGAALTYYNRCAPGGFLSMLAAAPPARRASARR